MVVSVEGIMPDPKTLEEVLMVHLYGNYTDEQYKKCAEAIRQFYRERMGNKMKNPNITPQQRLDTEYEKGYNQAIFDVLEVIDA